MPLNNKNSGVVYAFETDTVWGLGAPIDDEKAIEKIYELKNRDLTKPLILMSNRVENLLHYVKNVPTIAKKLMAEHFPGGLTLILERAETVPKYLNPGFITIGIRVPNHKGFSEFCGGRVFATTSCNISSEPPCASPQEVQKLFGDKVKVVGQSAEHRQLSAKASTIVAFDGENTKILRQGEIILFAK